MFLELLARGISGANMNKKVWEVPAHTLMLIQSHSIDRVTILFAWFLTNSVMFLFLYSLRHSAHTVTQHPSGPTGKPYHTFTYCISVTTNRAQRGVNREQRIRGSTVAYQQAPAVPKPPAAVLSSQHEGEGLTVEKCIHIRLNTHKDMNVIWKIIRIDRVDEHQQHEIIIKTICSISVIHYGKIMFSLKIHSHIKGSHWNCML